MKKIRTMEELAVEIHVSRPTLSKYFQDPSSVRKSTRSKIEAALSLVDYVPNFFAVNMNRKKTGLIGVIIPHINDLFFTSLVTAIEKSAMLKGYTIITQNSHGSCEYEMKAIENLRSMNADGVIIAPIGTQSDKYSLSQLNHELPLVFVDSYVSGIWDEVDYVGTDNNQSICLLVDYLCRSGNPPVFLGMPKANSNAIEREKAYVKRMRELRYEPDVIPLIKTDSWDFEAMAYRCMKSLFEKGEYTKASILCSNDRLAMGVIRAANEEGLFDSKEGFRVAGHDDHPLSEFLWPNLTTVSQDTKEIGTAVFDLLHARINGANNHTKGTHQMFDGKLILRDSA